MKSISKNRWRLIFAMLSLLLAWGTYSYFYHTNIPKEQRQFQSRFTKLESAQTQFKKTVVQTLKNQSISQLWKQQTFQKSPYLVYVFKGDSLVFWNANKLDAKKSLSNGYHHYIGHFSNGYFLVDKWKTKQYQIFIGSEIKTEYFYQNSALQNQLTPHFKSRNDVKFSWEKQKNNAPVVGKNGKTLIYLTVEKGKKVSGLQQILVFSFYVLGLLLLLIALTSVVQGLAKKWKGWLVIYPLFLLTISFFSTQHKWVGLFSEFKLFDPSLYASSRQLPSLGNLILSLLVVFVVIWWVLWMIRSQKKKNNTNLWLLIFTYVGLLFYALFIRFIFQSLILNSAIPLDISKVYSLTLYSGVALVIIATLFLSYYFGIRVISTKMRQLAFRPKLIFFTWFISGLVFFIIEITIFKVGVFIALLPLVVNGLFFYWTKKKKAFHSIKYNLVILVLFGLYGSVLMYENNQSNEHQKRELYAAQLISDQNPRMEVEYASTMKKMLNNPEFHQIIEEKGFFSAPNFDLQIENCCFGDFWERYEMNFFFFHPDGSPLVGYQSNRSQTQKEIQRIIKNHSTPSSIAKGLFFIKDYYNRLSYIGHQTVRLSDSTKLDFYILFRSKKMPEQIGFPRLLMNEKSYALKYLKNYSIARYSKGKLVMQFGKYDYPTQLQLKKYKGKVSKFVTKKGTSHLFLRQGKDQVVIISKPEKKLVDQLSTFSYLILFFGVYSLFVLIIIRWKDILYIKSLPLSFRVQSVLIGMVVGAFVIFAWVAVKNIRQRYGENTRNKLRDKMYSVASDVNQTIGDRTTLFSVSDKDYMNFLVKELAQTFGTDINFYTTHGQLIATSQPKLFEKGISAPLMNSEAYYALQFHQRSEFIHRENFGNLSFYSGYIPYRNNERKLLGYINLEHFSKQNIFKSQLNNFIVAIINLAVLFLVVTVIIALIVSRWITAPLRLIQQSIKEIELGKENKPIAYEGDDVIGTLVKEYNDKLQELELKAMQLAKSERESAWREMAKQVAHEIKNPLTPMKLSVQHFQRSIDLSAPDAKEKMNKIAQSLIEQIDALTKIANEFSNFAKMPKLNEEKLDLSALVQRVVAIYNGQNIQINVAIDSQKEYTIHADKNLLLRVLNNLIKNAMQAMDEERSLIVNIGIKTEEESFVLFVQDNGHGIPKAIQNKVFVPNFTTKSTGSGLGLAMVRQIILNHRGEIWFDTQEGEGTTFFVRLPRSEK